jgi:hypothetical protein
MAGKIFAIANLNFPPKKRDIPRMIRAKNCGKHAKWNFLFFEKVVTIANFEFVKIN